MAVEMRLQYLGELRADLEHGPSGTRIETEAPVDNGGRGQAFSPTDLVGAALISCAITTMAIRAPKEGIPFTTASGRVRKSMSTDGPRRISELHVEIEMPAGLDPAHRQRLEHIAEHCPVALSLAPEVKRPMHFAYPD